MEKFKSQKDKYFVCLAWICFSLFTLVRGIQVRLTWASWLEILYFIILAIHVFIKGKRKKLVLTAAACFLAILQSISSIERIYIASGWGISASKIMQLIGISLIFDFVVVIIFSLLALLPWIKRGKYIPVMVSFAFFVIQLLIAIIGIAKQGNIANLFIAALESALECGAIFFTCDFWKKEKEYEDLHKENIQTHDKQKREEFVMRYCSHCGKEIMEEAVICPHCGCATENYTKAGATSDESSTILNILSFFIPFIGLIIYLMDRDKAPKRASTAGKWAIIRFIVGIILLVPYSIILFWIIL